MKNIIKIIILTLILLNGFIDAQTTMQPGGNKANLNLDKFVGTWKWESNGDSFSMVLKKTNAQMPVKFPYTADQLYGFHEYKDGGIIVESSLTYQNTSFNLKRFTLNSFGGLPDPNQIIVAITHLSKNKNVRATIQWIDATHIKILNIEEYQGLVVSTISSPYIDGISLPQNITLTKQ